MPVIFPGFFWHNLNGGPLNQIPRNGGSFYWRQVYNAVGAGCSMLYAAMFDEMNEGTSMLKMAPTTNQFPVGASLVPLNIDGQSLPNDWYRPGLRHAPRRHSPPGTNPHHTLKPFFSFPTRAQVIPSKGDGCRRTRNL